VIPTSTFRHNVHQVCQEFRKYDKYSRGLITAAGFSKVLSDLGLSYGQKEVSLGNDEEKILFSVASAVRTSWYTGLNLYRGFVEMGVSLITSHRVQTRT